MKIFIIAGSVGIQMKRKELTKTFMMISNRKKTHFGLHDLYKKYVSTWQLVSYFLTV